MAGGSEVYRIFLSYGWLILVSGLLVCYCCLAPGLLKCYQNLTETRFRVVTAEARSVRRERSSFGESPSTEAGDGHVHIVSVDILEDEIGDDGMPAPPTTPTVPIAIAGSKSSEEDHHHSEHEMEDEEAKLAEAQLVSAAPEDRDGISSGRQDPSGSVEASIIDEMKVEDYSQEAMRSLRGRGLRALMLT